MAKPKPNSEEHTVELVTHASAVADLKICRWGRAQSHPCGHTVIIENGRRSDRLLLCLKDGRCSLTARQSGRLADRLKYAALRG